MAITKENLKRIKIPQKGSTLNSWLIRELESFFTEKLNRYYGVRGIDTETIEVNRREEMLTPDTYLILIVGLDKKTGRVEAQFLNNCCFAASIAAKAINK